MKKIIGGGLIVLALLIGYMGVQKFQDSSNSAEILGIEIEADNKSGQETAYIQIGLAVLLLGAGVYSLGRK